MIKTGKQRILSIVVFVIYLMLLVWAAVFKFDISFDAAERIRCVNLIPFRESFLPDGGLNLNGILMSVLLFLPFGIYISLLSEKETFIMKLAPGFVLSLIFETLQYILSVGVSDITDVMLNTLGAALGIGAACLLYKLLEDKSITLANSICFAGELLCIGFAVVLMRC